MVLIFLPSESQLDDTLLEKQLIPNINFPSN